jgi:beta-lactamase superfamily II metal-dependent hydrolase
MNPLKITIFDVEHGNCALVITPNGRTILIDCGHNDTTGFRPSNYLLRTLGLNNTNNRLSKLIISNVDQDHISDLPNVRNNVYPQILQKHPGIDQNFIRTIKEEMTEQFEVYCNMCQEYIYNSIDNDWGGMEIYSFQHPLNSFPGDTNNLSIITFLRYGGLKIVFPGDLAKEGWLEFLKNPSFIEHLKNTNIFVASHHGREDGYCQEIFNFCHPEVIIISDEEIKYDTQKDIGYNQYAGGIAFDDGITRKVLTTRNNGVIILESLSNNFTIKIQQA